MKYLKDYKRLCQPYYIKKVINGEEIDFIGFLCERLLTISLGIRYGKDLKYENKRINK